PGFQTPEEVRAWIASGNDLFNPLTSEYVFFDTEATDEFGISYISLDEINNGDIFEGYSETRNSRINADEFCQRVVNENGWGDISKDRIRTYCGFLYADTLWLGQGFYRVPYPERDAWRCRTDRGEAFLFIPRRGEGGKEPRPPFDVPLLKFVRSNGVPTGTAYTMDGVEGERGNPTLRRVPKGSELPDDVRFWAARCLLHVVLGDVLIKNNPVTTMEYGREYARKEREAAEAAKAERQAREGQRRI
ncbi:MAG: hypothetical protein IJ092_10820, partial [Atopobiaceae bacterium]|nr:hypothetical protein [Atopobiaceae bacterium]